MDFFLPLSIQKYLPYSSLCWVLYKLSNYGKQDLGFTEIKECKTFTPILTSGIYKGDYVDLTAHVPDPADKMWGATQSWAYPHVYYTVL